MIDYTKKVPGVRTEFAAYVICPNCHRTGMVNVKRQPDKLIFIVHTADKHGQPIDQCDIPVVSLDDLLKYRRLGPKPRTQANENPPAVQAEQRIPRPRKGDRREPGTSRRAMATFEGLFSPGGDDDVGPAGEERAPLARRIRRLNSRKR